MTNLKIKKLHPKANIPSYETQHSAGLDLSAVVETETVLKPGERKLISTGLAIELPIGYEAQIRPRSGLAIKKGISMVNAPGTIDADYRGEVKIILINHGEEEFKINTGDRIAQMVIAPVAQVNIIESSELSDTDRGAGGFGSTGV